jgi:hypothetical protein
MKIILQKKLVHWAALEEDEVYKNFEASYEFIRQVLRDHNLIGVSLHGEANDMDDEERERIMSALGEKFWKKLRDHYVPPECVYDQSSLFFNKMPNRMYIDKNCRKSTKGVKAMQSKD